MAAPNSSLMFLALLAAAAATVACRRIPPADTASPLLASIPSDTIAVAQADLNQLRASAFLRSAESPAHDLLERYRDDSNVLAAWNASELLIVLKGSFQVPAAGATVIAPGLAAIGSPGRIASAIAQFRSGHTGAPDLARYGAEIGSRSAIWLAIRGGASPVARRGAHITLPGNLANVSTLLEDADLGGAALDLSQSATLRLSARGHTPEAAERLEERLRAFLSLAGEGERRRPEISRLLAGAHIQRTDRDVGATLSASPDTVAKLLADFER